MGYKHFLTKLVTGKTDDFVKKRMLRYGKGTFDGPAIHVVERRSAITLEGSFLYEDLIGFLALKSLPPDANVDVSGNVFSPEDIRSYLKGLGLSVKTGRKSGVLLKYNVSGKIPVSELLRLYEGLSTRCYLLLSFTYTDEAKVTLKCRKTLPSWKEEVETTIEKKIKFCSAKVPVSSEVKDLIISEVIPDFAEEIEGDAKELMLRNTIIVERIIIPEELKGLPSSELRVKAIREGKILRSLRVDDKILEKEIKFSL
ncbi:MAG: hypothetical protein ACTSXJ_03950 [Candidatus Baldrarchaeia archaeon]